MTADVEVPPYVRLVNDIALQFGHLPPDAGAAAVAAHLQTFWDPRMRTALVRHAAEGGAGLDPLAARAAGLL
ncbi:formate dehydrogenase subunit delta [Pseudonocardia sp.]|uniref:formate dehydrogenase subunit delta n=1 Tax=Pseudonocardia sp. TaxID=60912 RepID=UPI003D0C23C1